MAAGGDTITRVPLVILGHGTELIDKRLQVPPKTLFVVSEECGVSGTLPDSIYSILSNPAYLNLFKHPDRQAEKEQLEALLGKHLRVYGPGQSCPFITYELFNTDRLGKKGHRKLDVYLSGVQRLPISPANLQMNPGLPFPAHLKVRIESESVPADVLWLAFRESFTPSQEFIRKKIQERTDQVPPGEPVFFDKNDVEKFAEKSQQDLFRLARGGAIFFMFLCRDVSKLTSFVKSKLEGKFPPSLLNVFNNDGEKLPYNIPGGIMDWISTRRTDPGLTQEQTEALNAAEALVAPALARRRNSRIAFGMPPENSRESRLIRMFSLSAENRDRKRTNLSQLLGEVDPMLREPHTGKTLLHLAAAAGDMPSIELILGRGPPEILNAQDKYGRTPVILAADNGHEDIVTYLLDREADASIVQEDRRSLLHAVASSNLAGLLPRVLAQTGNNPALEDLNGNTPLHEAAEYDAIDSVKFYLTNFGGIMNVPNRQGNMPFHLACQTNSPLSVAEFLRAGFSVDTPGQGGKTGLMLAILEHSEGANNNNDGSNEEGSNEEGSNEEGSNEDSNGGAPPVAKQKKPISLEIFDVLATGGASLADPSYLQYALENEYDALSTWLFTHGAAIGDRSFLLSMVSGTFRRTFPELTKAFNEKYPKRENFRLNGGEGGRRRRRITIKLHRRGRKTRGRRHR